MTKKRIIRYSGPGKNCESTVAVDIITLYLTCKLGYSPIRHILGLTSDKLIEDVIRHHKLGRKNVDLDDTKLKCPGDTAVDATSVLIIKDMVTKYRTNLDVYNQMLITTARWYDDPVSRKNKVSNCTNCNYELQSGWQVCPKCGTMIPDMILPR